MEYLILRNGNKLPCVGLGTWQITNHSLMAEIIAAAFNEEYRLFDTAAAYSNEIALSKALAVSDIKREDIFISDKVWNTNRGYEAVQDACKKSLKKLKTDYLDLYLVHWPASIKLYDNWAEINGDTWRGMEKLYKDGLVKNIGVCNFKIHHLEELKNTAEIMPFVNQIEFHPGFFQKEILDYCKKEGIVVEASSPLGNGQILQNQVLCDVAKRNNVSAARVCLRWAIQKGCIVIPKTSNKNRLVENISVFNFQLNNDDITEIDNIVCCGGIGIDPDEVTEFG